ncbi:MAG: gamma-glutamyl-gamma-aminobutyrate hydrolase family protein [Synergistaceae bacterium]|nr:gamma-glutamyl-gamma-aminobutyrate hydrolase family protein [Synergistaceae bacterium]
MKPLIGVATDPFRREFTDTPLGGVTIETLDYFWLLSRLTEMICASVENAGGIPVLLRAARDEEDIDASISYMNGFVFSGGEDIDPAVYGAVSNGSLTPNTLRDKFEFSLMKKAIDKDMPILGICRGCQMMNVVMGGTLYQDMPSIREEWELHSRSDVTNGYVHDVDILKPEIFPLNRTKTMHVNSMHHQGIEGHAEGLEVAAMTFDGLTESIVSMRHKFLLGVQWHPECLSAKDPVQADIFTKLIKAAE